MAIEKPASKGDIVYRRAGDEAILYNAKAKFIHMINSTAVLVWELCDGLHSIDEIEEIIRDKFEVSTKNDIRKDIQDIIEEFRKLKLLKG